MIFFCNLSPVLTRQFNILFLQLNPNDAIWIPIYGIHHDPKYYTDPEKFDPERFSEERMNEIKPFSYLPFGTGPRGCIGEFKG